MIARLMRNNNDRAVCLFAHHDSGGGVAGHVLFYLRALRSAGYEVHVARSHDRPADAATRSALLATGAMLHERPNAGLDFGAWQFLAGSGVAAGADEVLLANDSVFGPFRPLAPIRRAMRGFDVWGMVSSREGVRHLQSWFVCMTGPAFRRPAVQRVLAQPFGAMSKREIIVHGELGLSAAFEAEGLDVGARFVDRVRLRPSGLMATNPAHFRWRSLVTEGRVPFIKAELLRDNPSRVAGTAAWPRVVASLGGDGPTVADIRHALQPRSGTPAVPLPLNWRGRVLHLLLQERPLGGLLNDRRRDRLAPTTWAARPPP